MEDYPEVILQNKPAVAVIHENTIRLEAYEVGNEFCLKFEYSANEDFYITMYLKCTIENSEIKSKYLPSSKMLCSKGKQREFSFLNVSSPLAHSSNFSENFRLPSKWHKLTRMSEASAHLNPFYDIIFVFEHRLPLAQLNPNLREYYCFNFDPSMSAVFTSRNKAIPLQLIHHLYDYNHETIQVSPEYKYPIS